jgi:hypothetical protein
MTEYCLFINIENTKGRQTSKLCRKFVPNKLDPVFCNSVNKLTDHSVYITCKSCHKNCKYKVHPRTGHEGPEGLQMHSSTLSLTSALDGGGWSMPGPGSFAPEKDPVSIVQYCT